MARLMQVGECLYHHTIGLLEPLRAFRFCSAAPAPHAKPCHVLCHFPRSQLLISALQPSHCLSAPPERRDRTTERRAMQASFANDRDARRQPGGATCDEPHTSDNTL